MWQKNAKTGTAAADFYGASCNSLILRDSLSVKCLPLAGQHFPAIPGWIAQALRPQALPRDTRLTYRAVLHDRRGIDESIRASIENLARHVRSQRELILRGNVDHSDTEETPAVHPGELREAKREGPNMPGRACTFGLPGGHMPPDDNAASLGLSILESRTVWVVNSETSSKFA